MKRGASGVLTKNIALNARDMFKITVHANQIGAADFLHGRQRQGIAWKQVVSQTIAVHGNQIDCSDIKHGQIR